MQRLNWYVRGALVMAAFGILGQGCCGRRKHPKDAAQVVYPNGTTPPASTAAPGPAPKTN